MKDNLKHPFNVMRYSDWDAAPRMPQVIAQALIVNFGLTPFVANVIAYVAYTAVSVAAMRALAPDLGAMNKGTQVNTRSSIANQEYVYGQVRKGGVIAHMEATGNDNKYLHVFVALAGHEVEEIGDIYLNDQVVTLDGDGFVTSQNWNSKVFIKKFTGASSQTVFDDINALSGTLGADGIPASIDTNFKGKNIACVYMRLEYNQSTFTNGVPVVTAVVKGRKVFDPRTSTTAWSDNAALCVRDYITQSFGLNDSSVNDTYFSAAANDCDDSIPLAAGGGQARYTINGVVNAGTTTGQTLNDMISACNGSLFYSGGEWRLKVGVYTSPVKTLTLDDLRSEIDIPTRISRRDNFNRVVGKFIKGGVFDADTNPDGGDWIETEYPALESVAFTNEDNGIENTLDLPLYFITDASRAQRVAKQTLFRSREQISFSAEFGMNAMGLEVGDIVSLDIDEYGWSGKTFEVSSWKLLISQEGGVRVAMTLRETSSSAFAWDAEESDLFDNDTDLPNPSAGLTISGLTVTGGGRTQGDGTFINSALVNWNDVTNAFLDYYDVEWKAVADSVYSATTASSNDIELSPLVDGVQYIIRVRAVTNAGVRGDWATTTFTGGGDVTAPGLPTDVAATGAFKYITISWTNPADTDLNYVEVYENSINSTSGAILVGKSAGDSFVRTNLGLEVTRYYFLKAVDYSGNKSDFTTGVSATTTYLDDPDFENGIYTLFKDQGLYAIRDVTGLPTSGAFTGEKVFNRTDGKLYTWTGSAWEATVSDIPPIDFTDINGTLADAQVAVSSISGTKITDNSITTNQIAARTIQAGDIVSGTLTANEIAGNSITGDRIAGNTITAGNILGGTITGDKIAANTITGGLIAASGIITNSAQINNGVITNAKINDLSADKINAGTIAVDYLPGLVYQDRHYNPTLYINTLGVSRIVARVNSFLYRGGDLLITYTNNAAGSYGSINIYRTTGTYTVGATSGFGTAFSGTYNTNTASTYRVNTVVVPATGLTAGVTYSFAAVLNHETGTDTRADENFLQVTEFVV